MPQPVQRWRPPSFAKPIAHPDSKTWKDVDFTLRTTYDLIYTLQDQQNSLGSANLQVNTTKYALGSGDQGKVVVFNSANAITVILDSTVATNFCCAVNNTGTNAVTLRPSLGRKLNNAASQSLIKGQGCWLFFDGTNWQAISGSIGSGGSFTAGGDLSGTSSSQQVIGIQNHLIDGGPTNGKALVYSSGAGKWEPASLLKAPTEVALAPGAPGNFTVAHGIGATPSFALVQMTSGGGIWFQTPTRYDGTNLYLVASDAGITGNAEVFA